MDLFEHQAKELFASFGVPVPTGRVVDDPDAAAEVAAELGGRVVVKAQVKTGGRGKAGGVAVVEGPEQARAAAERILGMDIRGHIVHRVLIERASDIAEEYYASFLLDRAARGYLAMVSREGGVEIEEVAATKPEALVRVPVDPGSGIDDAAAAAVAADGGLPAEAAGVLRRLWDVFAGADATLVEVNPLVRTGDGSVLAVDGKVTLDDNARYRHPDYARFADTTATDPLETRARERGLNYVKLEGQVGIIGNGAGLVMSTLDVVADAGRRWGGVRPANFLDVGGGASAEVMAAGLEIVLGDPDVRSVLVNIFGGITQGDAVANGIVRAVQLLDERGEKLDRPLVVRLDGNNAEEGRRILREADIAAVRSVDTMDGAAALAAELAAGTGR